MGEVPKNQIPLTHFWPLATKTCFDKLVQIQCDTVSQSDLNISQKRKIEIPLSQHEMMVVIDRIPQEEFADVLFQNSGGNSIVNSDTEKGVANNSISFLFLLYFVKKYHWFARMANYWPLSEGNVVFFSSFQQLSCLNFWLLKGFLSWHGALWGPST